MKENMENALSRIMEECENNTAVFGMAMTALALLHPRGAAELTIKHLAAEFPNDRDVAEIISELKKRYV